MGRPLFRYLPMATQELTVQPSPLPESVVSQPFSTVEECENRLRLLGLSEAQITELGVTIDVIGDVLLDKYFSRYDR